MQNENLMLTEEVTRVLAEYRRCPVHAFTDDEVTIVIRNNREILNLYTELGEVVSLASMDLEIDGEASEINNIRLEIESSDPNQKGTRIRYCDGGYEFLQFAYKYYGDKSLRCRGALLPTIDEAKETAHMLFSHAPMKKKTFRMPLSANTYIQSVYPYEEFLVFGSTGERVISSVDDWVYTPEEMEEFVKGIRTEEIDKKISEFIAKVEKDSSKNILEEDAVKAFFQHNLNPTPSSKEMKWIIDQFLMLFGTKFKHSYDSDFHKIYQNEIGNFPLLKPEEEVSLAKRIEAGDIEAKEQMINSNLRLVYGIAGSFSLLPSDPMDRLDLVQEGNIGLMKAVERFDYRRGTRFDTYAGWWIRFTIRGAIYEMRANQEGISKDKRRREERISKVAAVRNRLCQELEREPTLEEIVEEIKIPQEKVAEDLMIIERRTVSLDELLGDGNGSLGDLIGEDSVEGYSSEIPGDVTLGNILTQREMNILLMRDKRIEKKQGFYTDEEIAEELGDDLEGIRQSTQNANRRVYENMEAIQVQTNDSELVHIKLSERMDMAASMITPGNFVSDLGEDYALIPIALCNEWNKTGGKTGIPAALAVAFNESTFKKTKTNLVNYTMTDQIELRRSNLTDGLNKLDPDTVGTVLISGSSPKVIKSILSKHAIPAGVSEMVLQSQQSDDISEVRCCIRELGFLIVEEEMLCDGDDFYPVIKCLREAQPPDKEDFEEDFFQELDDAFGPELLKNRDEKLKTWIEQEMESTKNILEQMENKMKDNSSQNEYSKSRQEELEHKMKLMGAAYKHLNKEIIDDIYEEET